MANGIWKMENLLQRTKQTGLVSDAECDAAAFAAGVETSDSGDVPEQSAGAESDAEPGRAVRFSPERGAVARAVASVDFADQRQPVVYLIGSREAEERHIVLRERADIPGGVNRR